MLCRHDVHVMYSARAKPPFRHRPHESTHSAPPSPHPQPARPLTPTTNRPTSQTPTPHNHTTPQPQPARPPTPPRIDQLREPRRPTTTQPHNHTTTTRTPPNAPTNRPTSRTSVVPGRSDSERCSTSNPLAYWRRADALLVVLTRSFSSVAEHLRRLDNACVVLRERVPAVTAPVWWPRPVRSGAVPSAGCTISPTPTGSGPTAASPSSPTR